MPVRLHAARGLAALVVVLAGAGGAILACGSDDAGSGSAAADGGLVTLADGAVHAVPIAEADLVPALVDALCSDIEPCCADLGLGFTAGTCAAVLRGGDAGLGATSALGAALVGATTDAGLRYDGQAAGDCVAALRAYQGACRTPAVSALAAAASFTSAAAGIVGCGGIFTGARALGEPCTALDACAPGAVCYGMREPSDGGAATGRCARFTTGVAEGGRCTDLADAGSTTELAICGATSAFDPASGSLAGILWCDPARATCAPIRAVADGQPCGTVLEACGSTSYCSAQKVCAPAAKPGEACGGASPSCVATAYCGADGRCVARAPLGASCAADRDCLSDQCNAKHVCASAIPGIASPALCGG